MFTSDEDMGKVKGIVKRMVKRAIALGGTCPGEHGVGIGKREYLYEELGEGTVELMKNIKRTIDPHNLFNPGKVCFICSLSQLPLAQLVQLYPDSPLQTVQSSSRGSQ